MFQEAMAVLEAVVEALIVTVADVQPVYFVYTLPQLYDHNNTGYHGYTHAHNQQKLQGNKVTKCVVGAENSHTTKAY